MSPAEINSFAAVLGQFEPDHFSLNSVSSSGCRQVRGLGAGGALWRRLRRVDRAAHLAQRCANPLPGRAVV